MSLPKKLERLIGKISARTDLEQQLIHTLAKRLENSLTTLRKAFGSDCADGCYEELISCVLKQRSGSCFDEYESCLEQRMTTKLRRLLTEQEETLVGEVVSQITSVTEALLQLAGVEVVEQEEPEDGLSGNP